MYSEEIPEEEEEEEMTDGETTGTMVLTSVTVATLILMTYFPALHCLCAPMFSYSHLSLWGWRNLHGTFLPWGRKM